ncbi:MAG: nitroreductase [Gammaproteobacteria bacterium]|nr:MAG: nitroreductase [Gammaproteobacteria bacterium]
MAGHLPDGKSRNLRALAERIRSRRTTNLFLKQEVSKDLVLEAIELARWAPNHHLTEPWHFYLLGDKMKAASVELIRAIVTENKTAELGEHKAKSAAAVPGWLLVTCTRSDDELREREDYASCCCAVQNILLYLSEAGVASKWTTGLITRDQRFFELLGIDESEEYVVSLIWYGYPKILPTQSRKDVSEIVTETD